MSVCTTMLKKWKAAVGLRGGRGEAAAAAAGGGSMWKMMMMVMMATEARERMNNIMMMGAAQGKGTVHRTPKQIICCEPFV
jgi:hypothetical protein